MNPFASNILVNGYCWKDVNALDHIVYKTIGADLSNEMNIVYFFWSDTTTTTHTEKQQHISGADAWWPLLAEAALVNATGSGDTITHPAFALCLYSWIHYTLDILFPSNYNVHKSSCGLCFWASVPLIEWF